MRDKAFLLEPGFVTVYSGKTLKPRILFQAFRRLAHGLPRVATLPLPHAWPHAAGANKVRSISAIDLTPVSAMAARISFSIKPSSSVTPASPAVASA